MNFESLCRVCAKENRLNIKIFSDEGIKQAVAKKMSFCLPIVVKESDNLPKQICLNCLSILDSSYDQYTKSLEAESIIKNLMLASAQSNGEMVKVYSTQELIKMMNDLQHTMRGKRPSVRLGNTVYRIPDAGNQTEATSNDEHRPKKRKQEEVVNVGGRSMMYPVAPLGGQQYMLMPSGAIPQAVMIPSAVSHSQFAIAPVPTYSVPAMQALPQVVATTAAAVQTNTSVPQVANVTNLTAVSANQTAPQTVLPGPTPKVQKTVAQPQNPILAFQKSSGRVAPIAPMMSTQVIPTPVIPPILPNTPSVTAPEEMNPIPERTPQVANNQEESPTEILPLISSDNTTPIITKRSPRSSPTPETSAQKSPSSTFMVSMGGGDDDDDDEYAADDPDPLQDESDEEITDTTQNNTTTEESRTEAAPELSDTDRDEVVPAVEELSSDGSVSNARVNSHKCPYCGKYFPDDVIYHHKKLHFRQKFFSCISCNKNFRTEAGLEKHRCD